MSKKLSDVLKEKYRDVDLNIRETIEIKKIMENIIKSKGVSIKC